MLSGFQMGFNGIGKKFKEIFTDVAKLFQGNFNGVPRKFLECLKGLSRKIEGCGN